MPYKSDTFSFLEGISGTQRIVVIFRFFEVLKCVIFITEIAHNDGGHTGWSFSSPVGPKFYYKIQLKH